MTEHIVAVFETEANATAAERDLEGAGIPSSAIRQYADTARAEATEHASADTSGGGFWSWLFGDDSLRETPAYTPDAYDRSAVAGNVVLSVTVHDETQVERVIAALEAHHPVDIDEDGAPGQSGSSAIVPPVGLTTSGHEFRTEEVASPSAASACPSGHTAPAVPPEATPANTASAAAGTGEEVIPVSEEQLEVGKRRVDRGTTRIRRYVVETPVEQNVTLHGERVTVERRTPIETGVPGSGAFEERVVEVQETAEEPVVVKTARVAEEVVVGREATERAETVRDTVRREEVEVSKDGELRR